MSLFDESLSESLKNISEKIEKQSNSFLAPPSPEPDLAPPTPTPEPTPESLAIQFSRISSKLSSDNRSENFKDFISSLREKEIQATKLKSKDRYISNMITIFDKKEILDLSKGLPLYSDVFRTNPVAAAFQKITNIELNFPVETKDMIPMIIMPHYIKALKYDTQNNSFSFYEIQTNIGSPQSPKIYPLASSLHNIYDVVNSFYSDPAADMLYKDSFSYASADFRTESFEKALAAYSSINPFI